MGRLLSLLQWVLITHQDKFRGLLEDSAVTYYMPVKNMYASCKIAKIGRASCRERVWLYV